MFSGVHAYHNQHHHELHSTRRCPNIKENSFSESNNLDEDLKELVGNNPDKKNWRGIAVALLVIAFILSLIIVAIIFTTPRNNDVYYGEKINFTEIFSLPRARSLYYQWVENDTLFFLSSGDVKEFTVVDRQSQESYTSTSSSSSSSSTAAPPLPSDVASVAKIFLSNIDYSFSLMGFSISADKRCILVPYQRKMVNRHATLSKYKVINKYPKPKSDRTIELAVSEKSSDFIQAAEWAPKNQSLAVALNNSIYYTYDAFNSQSFKKVTQLTEPPVGHPYVFYGVTDWLYGEEVLSTGTAFWWNSNAHWIAYVSFDNREVKKFSIPQFGSPGNYYPNFKTQAYSKCGASSADNTELPANPIARLHAYSLKSDREVTFSLPEGVRFRDGYYISFVKWYDEYSVLVGWMDRRQKQGIITVCPMPNMPSQLPDRKVAVKGQCQQVWKSADTTMGWLPLTKQQTKEPLMDPKNSHFYTVLYSGTEPNHWRTAIRVEVTIGGSKSNQIRRLTPPWFDVDDLTHLTVDRRFLFFTAALLDLKSRKVNPTQKHLYRLDLTGAWGANIQCVSCQQAVRASAIPVPVDPDLQRDDQELTNRQKKEKEAKKLASEAEKKKAEQLALMAMNCKYNSFDFSSAGRYFIQICSGPLPLMYFLRSAVEPFPFLSAMEDNSALRAEWKAKAMPKKEHRLIRVRPGDGPDSHLWVQLQYPPQLDVNKTFTYPLLLYVYGGPIVQLVTDSFRPNKPMWNEFLTSAHDMIIARVDGRGTANRGGGFLHSIYGNLGNTEVEDAILALRELAGLSFVDKNRMAVWGWSYGGFLTSHILGSDENKFATSRTPLVRCGIAVNPVTDFTYYDTAYTERYMGLITEKNHNYARTNISRKAQNFDKKQIFLIVGSGDDNVHVQNSAHFINALVESNVQFRFSMYPDAGHGLSGGKRYPHLFRSMTNFLMDCLNQTSVT